MPSIEEKAISKQVNYIKNKLKGVREATESVVSLLHNRLNVFDDRIEELVGCEVEHFTTLYRRLNNDFENFQERLIYIETYIESSPDCQIISKKPSFDGENPLQYRQETKSSSCHSNLKPADLQISTSSSCSSHVLQPENETIISFGNITEPISPSRLISHHSINNLGEAAANVLPTTFYKIDETESIENTTPHVLQTSSAFSNENFSASLQNNVNTYGNSSKSTSYASINDIEGSGVNLTSVSIKANITDLPESTASERTEDAFQLEQLSSHIASVESLSGTSCHRSLSSNLSDYQSACSGQDSAINSHLNTSSIQNESKISDSQTFSKKRIISSIQVECPMTITAATISHIENPGNFWMQLYNCESSRLCFPKKMFLKSDIPTIVEVGDFLLSPSKSVSYYLRVKVIAVDENDDHVKVFFIDHGSTQNVQRKELRVLPCEAYEIPMQVINCTLADISAHNDIWCYAAIQKFKELCTNSVEAYIKCQIDDKYAVQLIASVCDFNCDIGQSLCYDGFATEEDASLQITGENSASDLCDSNVSSMKTSNQLSSDSGVSVTSNQPSSPINQNYHYSSETLNSHLTKDKTQFQNELQELCSEKLVFQELAPENKIERNEVESTEELQNEFLTVSEQEQDKISTGYNKCLKICTCKCPLHLLIPLPSINFVEEYKVVVLLSHISHPNEFYVNLAMESSITLDELFEQMFNVYSPQMAQDTYSILLDDLKVGMFCAAWFNDGNWYRVKVLDIHQNFDQSHNVFVQYVDYGNKAWVKNTDLRSLTQEFAKYPSLSIKCSLAGIVPAKPCDSYNDETAWWNEEAVNMFKSMISYEKCFTLEIEDRTTIFEDDPLQVLLWDTQGEKDVTLNQALVDSKLAMVDCAAIEKLLQQQSKKKPDVEILSNWNPMFEEYNDIQNSYGVNFDDFQVATDGYKYRDEQYICKYYSLRGGYCPRNPCPYLHVPLAQGGVTRDQDELYSFNCLPPLPEDGSSFLIQVSAVKSPSFFYVQLPFGNLSVDELDSRINQGVPRESLQNQEMNHLFNALNEHYTNKPFDETTTIGLAFGSIVVARRLYDQTWHRARIIDGQDINKPTKVFYVDFGNEEWVDRRNIRRILPEFLHTPFQAIECCLYDVEPLGFEKGKKWSSYAVSCFKDLVSETIMLAHVAYKSNDTLQISLRRTTQNDHLTIKEHLIREGFGQEKLLIKTNKPSSKYIPG